MKASNTFKSSVFKKLNQQLLKIEKEYKSYVGLYTVEPSTFSGISDFFYKGNNLKKRRFSRYGEALATRIIAIILILTKMKNLLDKQEVKSSDLIRLLSARIST